MTALARLAGVALALAATAALVGLSNVDLETGASEEGLLRLSWRAVGERVEECRAPTEAELDALPPHMRPAEICEGRLSPFALEVRLDGVPVIDREVRPAGAREDRPTYVFDELPISPGPHRLEVVFATMGQGEASPPSPLRLVADLVVAPRRVFLVTRDDESDTLVLVGRGAP